jgi:hypothetical protein
MQPKVNSRRMDSQTVQGLGRGRNEPRGANNHRVFRVGLLCGFAPLRSGFPHNSRTTMLVPPSPRGESPPSSRIPEGRQNARGDDSVPFYGVLAAPHSVFLPSLLPGLASGVAGDIRFAQPFPLALEVVIQGKANAIPTWWRGNRP